MIFNKEVSFGVLSNTSLEMQGTETQTRNSFMVKRYDWSILIRVILMFITLTAASFLLVKGWFIYEVIAIPIIIYQVVDFFRFHKKAQEEVEEFVESVHYRDFSRYFDVKHAPA